MNVNFGDLVTLAEQDINLELSEVLDARALQYNNATPEEILNLLQEVAEPYEVLAPHLHSHLKFSAKKEIKFFTSLYQQAAKKQYST